MKPEPSEASQAAPAPAAPDVDSEDPIYRAMMAAAANVHGGGRQPGMARMANSCLCVCQPAMHTASYAAQYVYVPDMFM